MADDHKTTDPAIIARRAALSAMLSTEPFSPLSSSTRVEVAAGSRQGAKRVVNDDHYLVLRQGRLQETLATSLSAADLPGRFDEFSYAMVVADGLGEHGSGAVASRIAISTIAHIALHQGRWNVRVDPAVASEILERATFFYERADAAVLRKSRAVPEMAGMATALTTAFSAGDDLFVAHVGHSRAYLFRAGSLIPLTRDHTLARQLADTNRPAAVEARAQDLRHILTDAIGAKGSVPVVDVERFQLKNGDTLILCTNGLTDVIDETRISDVLALRRSAQDQCAILLDLAARRGIEDNATVIVAQYQIPSE